MKKFSKIIALSLALFFMAGCDKGFEEINTNPYTILDISNPGLLFTNILRNASIAGDWMSESTIAQQFVLPYNLGATAGYQFNENLNSSNSAPWGVYQGVIRTTTVLMDLLKDTDRTNMYNEARIWRVYHYMWLVDHYGDVPYFEAVRAQSDGIFYPKYDKGNVIYDDLYAELKAAIAALDPSKDNPSQWDIFVPAGASATQQVTFWRRLGNSLLLRMGMRYTKVNPTLASQIVNEAVNGGVMQSNADNAMIANMTGTGAGTPIVGYTNGRMGLIRGQNTFNYYLTKPLVDQLKNTNDPRSKFISAKYPNPGASPSVTRPNVTIADQFGFPIGYSDATITPSVPGYRTVTDPPALSAGAQGMNYSQINYNVVANSTTPNFIITYAQTKLLMAEAAKRGFLPGGDAQAAIYYYEGIDASMDNYINYPNVAVTAVPGSSSAADIYAVPTAAEKTAYKAQAGIVYNPATALEQINTQYWIECFNDGMEAWTNFRRSGFPALQPNLFNNNLEGGFIRRFSYLQAEQVVNTANYEEAAANLGGPDFLTTRVFWDIP